jgi:hypothetical protein
VYHASPAFVSVGCDNYLYGGGAHGLKSFDAMNFELPDLRPVRLEDVVPTDADSRRRVLELFDVSLAAMASERPDIPSSMEDAFGRGSAPQLDTFVITGVGLRFYFKGQLPHVIGDAVAPEVPWSSLRALGASPVLERVASDGSGASQEAPWGPWDVRAERDGLVELPTQSARVP